MNIDEKKKQLILQTLKDTKESNGSYSKTVRKLSIPTPVVEYVDVVENKRFNYTPEGRGRELLQKYIIAIKDVRNGEDWDNDSQEISEARKAYDDGRIEMATGRDGFNLILYAIPRVEQAIRKPYFWPVEEVSNVIKMGR
jgi:hypothetical protein